MIISQEQLLKELFLAASVSIVVLGVLENIKPGLVSAYLNLNYWLIFWVLSAIILIYYKKK